MHKSWHAMKSSQTLFCGFVAVLLVYFSGGALLRHFESFPKSVLYADSVEFALPHDDYDQSSFSIIVDSKPWYFRNGSRYPLPAEISSKSGIRIAKLYPMEAKGSDRFSDQMMFIPPNYNSSRSKRTVKTILVMNGFLGYWNAKVGSDVFSDLKCPVDSCKLTNDTKEKQSADLIIFYKPPFHIPSNQIRPPKQLYAFYNMESPLHTFPDKFPDIFNWTFTYRHDSTIPIHYGKWMYYDPRIKQQTQTRNYAKNKTKKVAWFVSNCRDKNGRLKYARELRKYIQVDIYGKCGTLKCPRSQKDECFDHLDKEYKFYLAFENSNCKDYITEKLFVNALDRNILPVVMGASREDYEKYAPERSYIHVEDFKSPKELADYLHLLDQNDELYNSYFKWKGTGEIVDSFRYMWCRICAVLHDDQSTLASQWYKDLDEWWRRPGMCTEGFWRDVKSL